jgi:hypothetical protein
MRTKWPPRIGVRRDTIEWGAFQIVLEVAES